MTKKSDHEEVVHDYAMAIVETVREPLVMLDAQLNLISNAIKYSPDAEKVMIHVGKKEEKALVSIQDFGMGIPKDQQDRIYERFFRAKGKKEGKIPGLGLGLFISTEILKQHGGKLWVDSIEKKGSTFYFTLPATIRKKSKTKR